MATIKTEILLRNDTADNWATYNPVLTAGEVGIEFSTVIGPCAIPVTVKKIKIGDGVTAWNDLEYQGGDIPADVEERLEAVEEILDDSKDGLVPRMETAEDNISSIQTEVDTKVSATYDAQEQLLILK